MSAPDLPPLPSGSTPVPSSREERTWGMLCHLAGLLLLVGIPLANVLGPLVVWLIKKEQYPFVDDQGKESLNFQISVFIYVLIAGALTLTVVLAPITIPLLIALAIFDIVMTIIAAMKANDGIAYRYPLTIRLIS